LFGEIFVKTTRKAHLVLLVVICLIMAALVAPAMRDNDQAGLISGALQLARGEVPFTHAGFYNYDKQYGTYLLLAGLYWLAPAADPVLMGNLFQVLLLVAALAAVALRWERTSYPPLVLTLPVLLSPVVVLFGPFLGTGSVSLAFLLFAFAVSRPGISLGRGLVVCILTAIASACRGDIALAIPAFYLAGTAAAPILTLLRRPYPWLLAFAAVAPVLVGKALDANTSADFLGVSFVPQVWVAFTFFGLGAAGTLLTLIYATAFLVLAITRRHRIGFYAALGAATLLPMVFYSVQLSTPRYFLLSAAILLFLASSRRVNLLYSTGWSTRWRPLVAGGAGLIAAFAAGPWIVGLHAPTLSEIRPTLTSPTLIPTSDGRIPIGAYLGFAVELASNRFLVDHNQKIWLAARSTQYRACDDGTVPLLGTGMVNYLELAVRVAGRSPRIVAGPDQSPCRFAYADARSLLRTYGGAGPGDARDFFKRPITTASATPELGQPVLRVDAAGAITPTASVLEALRGVFGGREFEVYFSSLGPAGGEFGMEPVHPYKAVAFAADPSCRANGGITSGSEPVPLLVAGPDDASDRTLIHCPTPSLVGWARTLHPAYMGQ
jgi:hypothetical protein